MARLGFLLLGLLVALSVPASADDGGEASQSCRVLHAEVGPPPVVIIDPDQCVNQTIRRIVDDALATALDLVDWVVHDCVNQPNCIEVVKEAAECPGQPDAYKCIGWAVDEIPLPF